MFLKNRSNAAAAGHPWSMSVGVVALIVASLSAAGTIFNMIASWATYRRVKPKVRLSVTYGPLKEAPRNGFLTHVKNVTPTATSIEEVAFVARYRFHEEHIRRSVGRRRRSYFELPHPAAFIPGDDVETGPAEPVMELPAFGGLR
jgi:hypothetical protein